MKTITNTNLGKHIAAIKRWILSRLQSTLLPLTGGSIYEQLTFGGKNFTIYHEDGRYTGHSEANQLIIKKGPLKENHIFAEDGTAIAFHNYSSTGQYTDGGFHITSHSGNDGMINSIADNKLLVHENSAICVSDNIEKLNPTINHPLGSYISIRRCGPLVFLHLDLQVGTEYNATNGLISGLPKPSKNVVFNGSNVTANGQRRFVIKTDGILYFDGGVPTATGWHHGSICYIVA